MIRVALTLALATVAGCSCSPGVILDAGGTDAPMPRDVPSPPDSPDAPTGTPPMIVTQPQDASVFVSEAASFTVVATGTAPLAYAWERNDGSAWASVDGATADTLAVDPVTLEDDGDRYRVTVSNPFGEVTSVEAQLTVAAATPPVITLDPISSSVEAGAALTFTADATGAPTPTWQWQRSDDFGGTWTDVSGATSASLTFTPGPDDHGAIYRAVARNVAGSDTSESAGFERLGPLTVLSSVGGAEGGASVGSYIRIAGIAAEPAGTVLVDYGEASGNVVRRLTLAGAATTVATISGGFAGGMVPMPSGDIHVANYSEVRTILSAGGQSTLVGGFNRVISGLVRIDTTLYATDDVSCVVHAVELGPPAVTRVIAGTPGACSASDGTGSAARFTTVGALVVDSAGDLLVCDPTFLGGNRLARVTTAGVVTTLPFLGPAAAAGDATRTTAACGVGGLAIDDDDDVYLLRNADVIVRRPNGVTAVVGRLPNAIETSWLGWVAPGYLVIGNGLTVRALDLR